MKRLEILCFLGTLCLALFCHVDSSLRAESDPPLVVQEYSIGLAGSYQVGTWTAASVRLTANRAIAAKLVVIAPDADGQLVRSEGPVKVLKPGVDERLSARFCSGRQSGDLTLRIEANPNESGETSTTANSTESTYTVEKKFRPGSGPVDGMVHELKRGFRQETPFWAHCGLPPGMLDVSAVGVNTPADGLNSNRSNAAPAVGPLNNSTDDPTTQLLRITTSEIPEDSADLAALDLLVIAAGGSTEQGSATTRPVVFSQLTERQNLAIQEWVQVRGGHLVVALGSQLQDFQGSPLGKWLALPLEGETEVRQLGALEAYSGHAQALKIERPVPTLQLKAKFPGQVLAQSLGAPLLIQMPRGFGRISFLAVDIDRPPLSNWPGTELMLRRLHRGDRSDVARESRTQTTQLSKPGINDLSTQVYAASESFSDVNRLSLWVVMLLMGTYILIVGPLDYLIVHRWLKRPNLTWITFPLWILAAACLSLWLARSLNGSSLLARQLEVIDIEATSGVVRGRSWMTLYSPKTSRRSIGLDTSPGELFRDPSKPEFAPSVSWLALAENRVGGLYREGGVQLTQRTYTRTADGSGFLDYPLQVWSTGRFGGEWSSIAPTLVESKLTSSGFGQLTGTLTHRLPTVLEDCLLAYGNRVYFPVVTVNRKKTANLPQFYAWDIGLGQPFEQRELRGFLTEIYTKTIQREGSKTGPEVLDVSKPYDPSRRDWPYIMRTLSFYQSAGGRDYTGLRNDVLDSLDLSQQLRMGRAVLIGRMKQPSARWTVDNEPVQDADSYTYVRVLLPVEKEVSSGYRALEKPNEGLPGPAK